MDNPVESDGSHLNKGSFEESETFYFLHFKLLLSTKSHLPDGRTRTTSSMDKTPSVSILFLT